MSGLLINGRQVEVPGVIVVNPSDRAWAHLNAGDGRPRTNAPDKVILHKTKGDDPERVMPGVGPFGRAERVAKFWDEDPAHSGAQLVIGGDYTACLADLVLFEAWHGNQANHTSIGIEHYEETGGVVYQAVLDAAVALYSVLAVELGIQLQFPRAYHGKPLTRFGDGGRSLVGWFGHRDVTSSRGHWDPGDLVFEALQQRCGAEAFDFEAQEDITAWMERQRWLRSRGHALIVDGVPGPATTAALRAEGYRGGIWALGKA